MPIVYKQIPTQYAFLVVEEAGKFKVRVHATRDLTDKVFKSRAEARKYINQTEIL